jgi:archaetidylinositol phosphate synthase
MHRIKCIYEETVQHALRKETRMPEIEKHERVHEMLLGPFERPALQWFCQRLPAWMTPDVLTIIGILGSIMTFAGYWLTRIDKNFLWLASLGFVVNWFGDSLDGNIARYRKIERPKYGYFVDHSVDSISMVLVFTGLGLSPYVRMDIACLALVGYLVMSIHIYIDAYVSGKFQLSYAKIGPTEMRLIAILANVVIYFLGNPDFLLLDYRLTVFDAIVGVIAILLFAAYLITTFNKAMYWRGIDQ